MSRRASFAIPVLVGTIAAVVYLVTQAPGLYYTDTGELAAAAATWGVAHPTGYPLFTLIAHVWTMLPWPSVIIGLNIFAALCVAASASVLVVLIRDLLNVTHSGISEPTSWIISSSAALMWAMAPTVWAQSTAIEVYSLNTLLFTLTLYFTFHSSRNHNTALAGLMFGFMLANHVSSIFLAPGLFWWWKGGTTQGISRQRLTWLVVPALMGPLLYLLLPLRSAALPPINWGWVHRGLDAFLYHVKGSQFGVWMFSDSAAVKENTSTFFTLASAELLWVGWIAVAIGIVILWNRWRAAAIGILFLMVGNLGISLGYAIPDIDAYFLPTLTLLALLGSIGMMQVFKKLPQRLALVTFAVPIIAFAINVSSMDHRNHRAVPAYARWALENAAPNAVIITRQWDYLCSAFWYLQTVEHVRPDVVMIDKELLRRTWYIPHLLQNYPDVMKGAGSAIDAYTPWLEQFESDADGFTADPSNSREIQSRFVSLLNAILEANPQRPIYITPELMQEERGFAPNYQAVPRGPLVELTKSEVNWKRKGDAALLDVVTSLQGRKGRLDIAMKEMVLSDLASSAYYAVQVQQDVGSFRFYRDMAIRLDPTHRTSRMLANQPAP